MKSLADILTRVAQDHPTTAKSGESAAAGADVCPICRGTGFVLRDVPISDPDFGKAQPCICTLKNAAWERAVHLRQVSNLGQLERLTFERFLPDGVSLSEENGLPCAMPTNTRAFAEKPVGWLVLHGSYGTGKTHLAAAIANVRLARSTGALRRRPRPVGLPARGVLSAVRRHLRSAFRGGAQHPAPDPG
ncbi:MAG: hypothetical protein IPO15_17015 [Anaerolineae bacterium]|uniref:hypothetical protein n=1 Tax=Candidatus Amarolinea dominans TaxID=3140696 RepID=UPI0031346604|nr:hypothetical protein [Anaerolineae bacterium]